MSTFTSKILVISAPICDECVAAGQNVFLAPTIHLPRPEYCFESHHSHLIYVIQYCFQKLLQKGQ